MATRLGHEDCWHCVDCGLPMCPDCDTEDRACQCGHELPESTELHRLRPMQLTHANIESVADVIRANGGATAGLQVRLSGPLKQRGLSIGTIHGIDDAYIGDWIVCSAATGEFRVRVNPA